MTASQLRVGVLQLESHPAVVLGDRDMLQEPVVPSSLDHCLTSLGRDLIDFRPCQQSIQSTYLQWHLARTTSLIHWLESSEAGLPHLLILPECSCPFETLYLWRDFAKRNDVIVFAGTHSPRLGEQARSNYRRLGVPRQILKTWSKEDSPPPAIATVFSKDHVLVHAKAIPSIFERTEMTGMLPSLVSPTIITTASGVRIALFVCAEALQLPSISSPLPDCVVILSYDRQPARFQRVFEMFTENRIPVCYANDGAFGGSGVFTAVDSRAADWWFRAPNNGVLPVGEAYLEVALDLAAPAVEVGVAAPRAPSQLIRLSPIYSDGDPLVELENAAVAAVDEEQSAKLTAIRLEIQQQHARHPLAVRRWAYLEGLATNGRLSDDWRERLAPCHVLQGVAPLRAIESALCKSASDTLFEFLSSSFGTIPSDQLFGQVARLAHEFRAKAGTAIGPEPQLRTNRSASPSFIGRTDVVAELRDFAHQKTASVLLLFGLQAIGKTALVRTSLEQACVRVLSLDCREGCTADYIFESVLMQAGKVPSGVAPRGHFDVLDLVDALRGYDVLWLESCHNLVDHGIWRTGAIKQLLDGFIAAQSEVGGVLICEGRRNLPLEVPMGKQIFRRRLAGLVGKDGPAFLEQQLRRAGVSLDAVSEDNRIAVSKHLDGHPGMIILCADAIARSDVFVVLDELKARRGFFLDAITTLLSSLQLTGHAQRVLEALAASPRGVPADVFTALMSSEEASIAIRELRDASLIEIAPTGVVVITGLLDQVRCFPDSLSGPERKTFHIEAAKRLASLARTAERDYALMFAVESNYHAARAGISPLCDIGGLMDGVSAAARRDYEEQRYESVIRLLANYETTNAPEDMLAILADSYAWCNQFQDAFRVAARVIERSREFLWLYTEACRAALRAHQLDSAKKAVELAEALEPGNYMVMLQRGHIALREKRLDDAEAYYEKAAERSERDAWPHFYLSRLLIERGYPDRAVEIAERGREIIEKFPYSRGRRNLETALLSQEMIGLVLTGDEENARQCLSAIERSDSTRPEVVLCTAYMTARFSESQSEHERIEAFDRALTRLRRVDSRQAHRRAQICLFRGKIYEQLGNLSDAETEFAEACRLDAFNIYMKMCYARVLVRIAKFARNQDQREAVESAANRAVQVIGDVLRLQPSHEEARNLQEDIYAEFRVH